MTGPPSTLVARKRRFVGETNTLLQGMVYQDDTTAAQNLDLFDRFDRWTVLLFADYWECTTETARKRLGHLAAFGVVVRVAGAVSGYGGREPDLYVLAPHGALVLDHRYHRPRHTTKAPQLAVGTATTTVEGRTKLTAAPGNTTPHLLNCLRLALHQGWVDDERWRIMRRRSNGRDEPIPDFALTLDNQFVAVEVEGTLHRAHINEKHRRYAMLARQLGAARGTKAYLSVVLTFPDDRDYANARRSHELAYARQGRDYGCFVARLPAVLASPPGTPLWNLEEALDWRALRERERTHHERMGRLYDGW